MSAFESPLFIPGEIDRLEFDMPPGEIDFEHLRETIAERLKAFFNQGPQTIEEYEASTRASSRQAALAATVLVIGTRYVADRFLPKHRAIDIAVNVAGAYMTWAVLAALTQSASSRKWAIERYES